MTEKVRWQVLFLCTGNSARSQMAEGFLRTFGGGEFEASSAGTHPRRVQPEAVSVMKEAGVDISRQMSKSLNGFIGREFDYVITVCDDAAEECPSLPGESRRLHWSIPDPAGAEETADGKMEVFRNARDMISERVKEFVDEHGYPEALG